ncbi:ZIP family metal transporter [Planococcus sp. 11815]|uniref:hypothetical protein n=1 Tax=Planococcus sp. 11815 TaxID=2939413 RepID=UPI003DA62C60
MVWLSLLFIMGFVVIHLFSKNMNFLKAVPRSRFLSIAGGISVAYVFLHLLPELGEFQEEVHEEFGGPGEGFLSNHIYLAAMAGLVIFYGLEQMVKNSKRRTAEGKSSSGVFWIHIGSFAMYNGVIGYLMMREEYEGVVGMALFFIALGVHFITNDKGLREAHKGEYDRYGRWLLAGAIVAGWVIGWMTEVHELVIAFLMALIAGGVILNVLKEELPEERESSLGAFVIGLAVYSVLLLFI